MGDGGGIRGRRWESLGELIHPSMRYGINLGGRSTVETGGTEWSVSAVTTESVAIKAGIDIKAGSRRGEGRGRYICLWRRKAVDWTPVSHRSQRYRAECRVQQCQSCRSLGRSTLPLESPEQEFEPGIAAVKNEKKQRASNCLSGWSRDNRKKDVWQE
ncbi:hypothetical protein DL95DRAFT_57773 [Leptodontidium sp. 2 PMI_412]|nr:hypothetical protein DL95DRAFT_57773 [Leptodontidium sp. 2 PMI_412]